MGSKFPYAEHLWEEEVNYELKLRNYVEDIGQQLETKQRLLRRLFHRDGKENREYRSFYSIEEEFDLISSRVNAIRTELARGVDAKLISRLKHYYLRAARSNTKDDEALRMKQSLLSNISDMLIVQSALDPLTLTDRVQPESNKESDPEKSQSSGNESQHQASNGKGNKVKFSIASAMKKIKVKKSGGAMKKRVKNNREEDKLKAKIVELESQLSALKLSIQTQQRSRPSVQSQTQRLENTELSEPQSLRFHSTRESLSSEVPRSSLQQNMTPNIEPQPQLFGNWTPEPRPSLSEYQPRGETLREMHPRSLQAGTGQETYYQGQNERNNRHANSGQQSTRQYNNRAGEYVEEESANSNEDYGRWEWDAPNWNRRGNREDKNNYDRKIEKWNLTFSGDARSPSLEDFIFKVKVLASMNSIPSGYVLSNIHLLLRGDASNWFFTYYQPSWTWAIFETRIRFRFGNPNQDQGNRQRIYDRKQQKGETFIAFVTEIERLNKLLTKPLGNQRKFEVIWENMRQHYRSKLACFVVNELDELIQFNYRIDANDPSLHPVGPKHMVNNIEEYEEESENEEINAVNRKPTNNHPQPKGHERNIRSRRDELQEERRQPHCWNCRQHGHFWRDCREQKTTFCYVCGTPGTISTTCENHPRRNRQNQGGEAHQFSGN